MTWATRAATLGDAAYVFDHIWPRGAVELDGFKTTRDKWLAACQEMIATAHCWVFTSGSAVQAMLGLRGRRTWFQAVADVEMAGLTRHLRRVIPMLVRQTGIASVELFSLCVLPDAPRWFNFLGFAEDNAYRGAILGGHRERRFVGKWG